MRLLPLLLLACALWAAPALGHGHTHDHGHGHTHDHGHGHSHGEPEEDPGYRWSRAANVEEDDIIDEPHFREEDIVDVPPVHSKTKPSERQNFNLVSVHTTRTLLSLMKS